LNYSIDEDGIPMICPCQKWRMKQREYSPRTVKLDCIGMIKAKPAECLHTFPPCRVSFVTGHDNMVDHDPFTVQNLCFHFFHTSRYHGERREALGRIFPTPGFEITVAHVDSNPL
jgi:hypothetical protein